MSGRTPPPTISDLTKKLADKEKELAAFQKKITKVTADLTKSHQEIKKKDLEISQLQKDKDNFTKEITTLNETLQKREKDLTSLKTSLADITSKYTISLEKIESIKAQIKRPIATPTELAGSFAGAIEAMRKEFKTADDSPVDYRMGSIGVTLKTGIGRDAKENISFWLPKAEEISAENLSTVQFSIKAIPKPRRTKK